MENQQEVATDQVSLQLQLRRHNEELQDAIRGLNSWEDEIKKRDDLLKKQKPILKKSYPPIRGKQSRDIEKTSVKSERLKSYDYSGWSKFDVDAACDAVDDELATPSSSEDDEGEEKSRQEMAMLEKERGNQLYQEGKYTAAVERYTEAINLYPTSAILSANRAMALLKLERYGAAESDCDVAISLDETYVKAWMRRGIARLKQNKLSQAKDDILHVLVLDPNNKLAKTELQRIEKMMDGGTGEIKTTSDDKRFIYPISRPSHMRSKRALVRISVDEVSLLKTANEDMTPPVNVKDLPHDITGNLPMHRPSHLPLIPTSSIQFQRDWKTLRSSNMSKLPLYFKSILPIKYPAVLAHSLETDVFSDIISILEDEYIKVGVSCVDQLKWISQVQRFDVALAFLNKSDRESLQRIFKGLITLNDQPSLVLQLANSYSITGLSL
jgi:tetratricopeptide (TPR) repeat protein